MASLSQDLQEALLNNTYDYDPMHTSLLNEWVSSFSYLYTSQKSFANYIEQFYYPSDSYSHDITVPGKLYLTNSSYCAFDVDYDFIESFAREPYRLSEYYNKPFTVREMIDRKDIFVKIPILIIDDHTIWDFTVTVDKDNSTFTLPFKTNFLMEDQRNQTYLKFDMEDNLLESGLDKESTEAFIRLHKDEIEVRPFDEYVAAYERFCDDGTIGHHYDDEGQIIYDLTYDQFRKAVIRGQYTIPEDIMDHAGKKRYYFTDPETLESYYLMQDDSIIYLDHKIQLLTVDNFLYERVENYLSGFQFDAENHVFGVEKSYLDSMLYDNLYQRNRDFLCEKYHVSDISELDPDGPEYQWCINYLYNKFTSSSDMTKDDGILMCSIHPFNYTPGYGEGYELGTFLIPLDETDISYTTTSLDNETCDLLSSLSGELFYVSFVFVNNLHKAEICIDYAFDGETEDLTFKDENEIKNYPSGLKSDIYVIEKEDLVPHEMPIPVENFMVIKGHKDDGNEYCTHKYLVKNNETIHLHYPNIYTIETFDMEENDVFTCYYFYLESPEIGYTSVHDFYFRFLAGKFVEYKLDQILNKIYHDEIDLSDYNDDQKEQFAEVFRTIMDYQYYHHDYADMDFVLDYKTLPEYAEKYPEEYQIQRMREFIRVNPWLLRDYVLLQNKVGSSYHLYTKTIDLESRIRYDTSQEFPDETIEFNEPRYVFSFTNTKDIPDLLDMRVFVDGLLIGDLYQDRFAYADYFYIPCTSVTEDSFIEIEVFPGYAFEEEISFDGPDDEKTITLIEPKEDIYPTVADLYFLKENDEETYVDDVRYDRSLFDITVHRVDYEDKYPDKDDPEFPTEIHYINPDFPYVENPDPKKPIKFSRITQFKIKPNSFEVENIQNLKVCIGKMPKMIRFVIDQDLTYPYIEIVDNNFNFSTEYIRIFRNGRLLPRSKYRLFTTYNRPRMMIQEFFDIGDFVYIDITPYRYHEIFYLKELDLSRSGDLERNEVLVYDVRYQKTSDSGDISLTSVNEYTLDPDSEFYDTYKKKYYLTPETIILLDLREVINKPFDIRYYDVYCNGRKLSSCNVIPISPWQITLINLKSVYNIVIYEKERDWEYFGLDYKTKIYAFSFSDLDEKELISNRQLKDTIDELVKEKKEPDCTIKENTNDEIPMDWGEPEDWDFIVNWMFYNDELIPNKTFDPDLLQVADMVMTDVYSEVNDIYRIDSTNPNHPSVILLDPDILIPGDDSEGEVTDSVVFANGLSMGLTKEDTEVDDETLKEWTESETEVYFPAPTRDTDTSIVGNND